MPKLNRRRGGILAPRALRPQKNSGGKAALIYQRVEDDAFHLCRWRKEPVTAGKPSLPALRRLRRKRSDDCFKARVSAQRVPKGMKTQIAVA